MCAIGTSFRGGNTYIHWGRNSCEGAEVVYNGVAVAALGSNPICLPKYNQDNDTDDISLTNVPPVFDFDAPERARVDLSNKELTPVGVREDSLVVSTLLCALCFLPNLPAPTVIIGTDVCPLIGEWRLEYYGQLVTGSTSGGDFICADVERARQAPPPITTDGDDVGNQISSFAYFIYSVSADCQGTSPGCPAGQRFDEIPCAVCTRVG